MGQYLKYLIQLILSPAEGWEDIAAEHPEPGRLQRAGFLPLLGVCVLTVFVPLFTGHGVGFVAALADAIIQGGVYFVSLFTARLILELYMPRIGSKVTRRRTEALVVCAMGLMVIVQAVTNVLPWTLLFMRFMPLYVVLVLYKSAPFMEVPEDHRLNYLLMASLACVAVPLVLYYLLILLI